MQLVKGIQIPTDVKITPSGISNQVLFVDYDTTQYILDVFDNTELPMLKPDGSYIKPGDQAPPKVNKKADMLRFHLGKYYTSFPADTVYTETSPNPARKIEVLNNFKHRPPEELGKVTPGAGGGGYKGHGPSLNWTPLNSMIPIDQIVFSGGTPVWTPAGVVTITRQWPDTDRYDDQRTFSPVNFALSKKPTLLTQTKYQQWGLINFHDMPLAGDDAIHDFEGSKDQDSNGEWKKYVLNEEEITTGDLISINKLSLRPQSYAWMGGGAQVYTDHAFKYNYATNRKSLIGNDLGVKYLYGDVQPEYNFYLKTYEAALEQTTANVEQYLPNLYVLTDIKNEMNIEEIDINPDYAKLISLDGLGSGTGFSLYDTLINANFSSKEASEIIVEDHKEDLSTDPYLSQWGSLFGNTINEFLAGISANPNAAPEIFTKSRNLIIPPHKLKDLPLYEDQSFTFPMSTKIEFTTDSSSEVADIMIKTNIWDNILQQIVTPDAESPYMEGPIDFKGYTTENLINVDTTGQLAKTSNFNKTRARVFNLGNWLDGTKDPAGTPLSEKFNLSQDSFMMLDHTFANQKGQSGYDHSNVINNLAFAAFKAKLKKIMWDNSRTFQQILSGDLCYNETLFYRVEKIDVATSEVVQNFYFVNHPDVDTIKYIDTQVFYNKKYEYKIYSWQLVAGTKYNYRSVTFAGEEVLGEGFAPPGETTSGFPDASLGTDAVWETMNLVYPDDNIALLDIRLEDNLVLLELPYYEHQPVAVIDDPPVPPGVELIPFKNTGDKILMYISPETGEYDLDAVTITAQDEINLESFREARGYGPDEKIRYTTDDYVAKFEIFRLDRKPKSYKDFDGSKIVTLENKTTFIDDTIQPNTKYYYILRAIDVHGHVSNPSPVYELELIQNLEAMYPVVNLIFMEDHKKELLALSKSPTKECSKYLFIQPTLTQRDLNYIGDIDLEDATSAKDITPKLGYEDESVFGNKFKIRLISKKTGKRIDFNVDFKTNYDKGQIVDKNNELP